MWCSAVSAKLADWAALESNSEGNLRMGEKSKFCKMANVVGRGKMKFIGSNDSLGTGSPAEINLQLDTS